MSTTEGGNMSTTLSPGTYLREPDGANLLRYSPEFYPDAAAAHRARPAHFLPVSSETAQALAAAGYGQLWPGEYVEVRETDNRDAIEAEAYRLGAEAGRAAASWYFDTNTTRDQYGAVLTALAEGDPAIYDTFPQCPLSGEWADDPTPGDVLRALGVDEFDYENDDLLSLYEDGFGVAVADAIEAEARERYAALEPDNERTRRLARAMCGRFTRRTREDGTQFVTLTDAAEEWMHDVVREGHGDMLPEDWRYETIAAAVEFIADNGDADDRADEFADGCTDTYTSDLLAWVGSHASRMGWVEEARAEWGTREGSFDDELRVAQYLEAREVFGLVYAALEGSQEPA